MVVKFSCPIRTRSSVKRLEMRLYLLQRHSVAPAKDGGLVPFALIAPETPSLPNETDN
jgi:hypothetical protein